MSGFAFKLMHRAGSGEGAVGVFSIAVEMLHKRMAGRFAVVFPNAKTATRGEDLRRRSPWVGDVLVVHTRSAEDAMEARNALGGLERFVDFTGLLKTNPKNAGVASRKISRATLTPAAIERMRRRSERNGRVFVGPKPGGEGKSNRGDHAHIRLVSASNGQNYPVYFRAETGEVSAEWATDGNGFLKAGCFVPSI